MAKAKPVFNFRDLQTWFEDDILHWKGKVNQFEHVMYKDWGDDTPEAAKIKQALADIKDATNALHAALVENNVAANKRMLDRFKRISEVSNNG